MTNEELVTRIQQANDETETENLYLELWQGVYGIVFLKAAAKVRSNDRQYDIDDMLQESFLALPAAAQQYDPALGVPFASYFARFFLPPAFDAALYGSRSTPARMDPLNNAQSLDAPLQLQHDTGSTLLETIIDPEAETPYLVIDDDLFWIDVARFIDKGIDRLPEGQRQILRFMYTNDASCTEAYRQRVAGNKSRSRYGQLYRDGLRNLNRWIRNTARNEAESIGIFDVVTSKYYAGSLGNFRNHGFTSNVETIALDNAAVYERTEGLRQIPAVLR